MPEDRDTTGLTGFRGCFACREGHVLTKEPHEGAIQTAVTSLRNKQSAPWECGKGNLTELGRSGKASWEERHVCAKTWMLNNSRWSRAFPGRVNVPGTVVLRALKRRPLAEPSKQPHLGDEALKSSITFQNHRVQENVEVEFEFSVCVLRRCITRGVSWVGRGCGRDE